MLWILPCHKGKDPFPQNKPYQAFQPGGLFFYRQKGRIGYYTLLPVLTIAAFTYRPYNLPLNRAPCSKQNKEQLFLSKKRHSLYNLFIFLHNVIIKWNSRLFLCKAIYNIQIECDAIFQ